jgi:hypothetical protein
MMRRPAAGQLMRQLSTLAGHLCDSCDAAVLRVLHGCRTVLRILHAQSQVTGLTPLGTTHVIQC